MAITVIILERLQITTAASSIYPSCRCQFLFSSHAFPYHSFPTGLFAACPFAAALFSRTAAFASPAPAILAARLHENSCASFWAKTCTGNDVNTSNILSTILRGIKHGCLYLTWIIRSGSGLQEVVHGQAERQGNRLADDESRRGLFLIITRFRPSLASRKRHLARFAEFVPFTPRRVRTR